MDRKKRKQGVNFHRREQSASVVANRIFIGNMDKRVTEYQVVQLCRPYGTIVQEQYCWTTTGPQKGTPSGYCFVEFSNRREAEAAVKGLHGRLVGGRNLRVDFAREQENATAAAVQQKESEREETNAATVAVNAPSGGQECDGEVEDGSDVVSEPIGNEREVRNSGGANTSAPTKVTPKDIARYAIRTYNTVFSLCLRKRQSERKKECVSEKEY